MIADKYIELIHRELDGANTPAESARLKAYFAANPAAQQFYEELTEMSGMLKEVRAVEPPAHLQQVIMNMLPPNRYAAPAKASWLTALREWLETKFNFKYAYAFAGGLTFGIVMYALLLQTTFQPADLSKLSGTMAPAEQTATENFAIAAKEVSGNIAVRKSDELVLAEIALASQQPVELVIAFDETNVRFKGLDLFDQPAPGDITILSNAVKLIHAGQRRYDMTFIKKNAAALHVKILLAGNLVYERTFENL
jgi:anti-sigma factor RsiW